MQLIRLLKNDLARESAEWVDEKIISTAQAEQISQRYGVDYHQAQNRSLGYMVLVGLAYLFIGLAVITLLGHNWDEIPRALRMGGLITITLTVQALALRVGEAGAGLLRTQLERIESADDRARFEFSITPKISGGTP